MPFYYFDSTALVKRYSAERGSRMVNGLLAKRGRVALVSTPTLNEFYSVLANQAKQGDLTRDDWYSVVFKFEVESDRGMFNFISPNNQTYLSAKELNMEFPSLRSAQAIHLALALELKPLRLSMVSADKALLETCRPLGIKPINPED